MKNKNVITPLVIFLLLSATQAFAAEDSSDYTIYFSGNIAITHTNDAAYYDVLTTNETPIHYDNGFGIVAAVGFKLGRMRIEGEGSYQIDELSPETPTQLSASTGSRNEEVTAASLMCNAFVDFTNDTPWKSYLMIGGGTSLVDFGGYGDDVVPAIQYGAGIGYQLTDHLIADFQYRHFQTQDPDNNMGDYQYCTNRFLLGVRLTF